MNEKVHIQINPKRGISSLAKVNSVVAQNSILSRQDFDIQIFFLKKVYIVYLPE